VLAVMLGSGLVPGMFDLLVGTVMGLLYLPGRLGVARRGSPGVGPDQWCEGQGGHREQDNQFLHGMFAKTEFECAIAPSPDILIL
jgi:hypothetical protein